MAGELWSNVSDQSLSKFADQLHDTEDSVANNALFFADDDHRALREILKAADFYLQGKTTLHDIRHGEVSGERVLQLARAGERSRFVDEEIKKQIKQNKRWLTRYRNLLDDIRSRLQRKVGE